MSLNTLAGNDRDIGVIGEQGERSAEVLRREAPAEVIDRRENAFEIGRRGHLSTIPQDRASESRPVQAVALSGQIEARQAR